MKAVFSGGMRKTSSTFKSRVRRTSILVALSVFLVLEVAMEASFVLLVLVNVEISLVDMLLVEVVLVSLVS